MVALATAATIIASQAVITGAYSLTQQAIQLGLLPRMEIRRTSETEKGQIYIPRVNWLLLIAVVYLVDRVPLVERARLGLRHRRHRHDGDHDRDGLLRAVEVLAAGARDGGPRDRAVPRDRSRVPRWPTC